MRIYVVKFNETERLVEANTPSQAVRHVVAGMVTASAAKPQDVASVMAAGAKLERASAEIATQE